MDQQLTTDRLFMQVREQLVATGLLELRGHGFNATQLNEIASWAARQIVRRVRIMRSGSSLTHYQLAQERSQEAAEERVQELVRHMAHSMVDELLLGGAVEITQEDKQVSHSGMAPEPTRVFQTQLLVLNPNMDVVR